MLAVWWTTTARTVEAYDGAARRIDSSAPQSARLRTTGAPAARSPADDGVVDGSATVWSAGESPGSTSAMRRSCGSGPDSTSTRTCTPSARPTHSGVVPTRTTPAASAASGSSSACPPTRVHGDQAPAVRVRVHASTARTAGSSRQVTPTRP